MLTAQDVGTYKKEKFDLKSKHARGYRDVVAGRVGRKGPRMTKYEGRYRTSGFIEATACGSPAGNISL